MSPVISRQILYHQGYLGRIDVILRDQTDAGEQTRSSGKGHRGEVKPGDQSPRSGTPLLCRPPRTQDIDFSSQTRVHGVAENGAGWAAMSGYQFTLSSWPPPWPALRFHRERRSVCETEKPEVQRVHQILFWLLPQVRLGPHPSYTCQGLGVMRMSGWEKVQAYSDLVLGE